MITLRKLLSASEIYPTEKQRLNYVKLLIIRGCLSKSVALELKDSADPKQSKLKERAIKALQLWPKGLDTGFLQELDDKKINEILDTDIKVNEFLDKIQFETLEKGADWLVNAIDLKFLRKSFDSEGIKADNDKKPEINLARWIFEDRKKINEIISNPNSSEYKVFQLLKSLELIDEFKAPKDKKIDQIYVQGCTQKFVEPRVKFVVDTLCEMKELTNTIPIFYVTSYRGLFNDEESLAEILASADFLNVPTKVSKIKKVLEDSKENWTSALDVLKEKILKAVDLTKWPEKVNSYYNEDPVGYDKRQSLKGWPVAMDMIKYLFFKHASKNPKFKELLSTDKTVLISVPTHPSKVGAMATTNDNAHAYYEKYGKYHDKKHQVILFVSDNIIHDIVRQGIETSIILKSKSNNFEIINSGPGADALSASGACDSLAKYTFVMMDKMKKTLTNTMTRKVNVSDIGSGSNLGLFSSNKDKQTPNKDVSTSSAVLSLAIAK